MVIQMNEWLIFFPFADNVECHQTTNKQKKQANFEFQPFIDSFILCHYLEFIITYLYLNVDFFLIAIGLNVLFFFWYVFSHVFVKKIKEIADRILFFVVVVFDSQTTTIMSKKTKDKRLFCIWSMTFNSY